MSPVLADLFSVAVHEGDRTVVVATGELDLATTPQLEAELGRVLDRAGAGVVLDLRGLTFIDSSGVHLLMRSQDEAHRRDIGLTVLTGPGAVRRALDLCGVLECLDR
jgi:anti-sigma B factor antagonist